MPICPHPYELQSLADRAGQPELLARLREHVAACEDCGGHLAELERLRWLLRERKVETPEGLRERVLQLVATAIPVRKLACREAQTLASAYVDEELNEVERETLEAHLFACDDCYYEYVAMRTAALAMRETPRVAASEDLKSRIMAAVTADAAATPATATSTPPMVRVRFGSAWNWRRVLVPALAVAAVALFTVGAFHVRSYQPTTGAGSPPAAGVVASLPPPATEPAQVIPALPVAGASTVIPAPSSVLTPSTLPAAPLAGPNTLPPPEAFPTPTGHQLNPVPNLGTGHDRTPTLPPYDSTGNYTLPPPSSSGGGGSTRVIAPPPGGSRPTPAPHEGPRFASTGRTEPTPIHTPSRIGVTPMPSADLSSTPPSPSPRGTSTVEPSRRESTTSVVSACEYEDTPPELRTSRNRVKLASTATVLHEGGGNMSEALKARAEEINAKAAIDGKASRNGSWQLGPKDD